MKRKMSAPPLCPVPAAAQWEGDGHRVVTSPIVGLSYASFYRACVDGLDASDAAAWYLDPATEAREPDVIFDRITEALVAAARRHHADVTVAVLSHLRTVFHRGRRPSPDAVEPRGRPWAKLPASPLPRGERGIRLRRRAIDDAISWTHERPRATDMLSDWLSVKVTDLLASAGIQSIGNLAHLMAREGQRGPRWWRAIEGLGRRSAEKVDAWMRHLAQGLIDRETLALAHESASRGIAVLQSFDRFAVPADLDGRQGTNRRGHVRMRPETLPLWADDRAVLSAWLDMYRGNDRTYRSYLRMVERLWLWAVLIRGKAFSSLTTEDCIAWLRFLDDLPEDWVHRASRGTRPYEREGWRPFDSKVGPRSLERHFSFARSLFAGLQRWLYLEENPMDELRLSDIGGPTEVDPPGPRAWQTTDANHSFSEEEWSFLLRFADEDGTRPHEKRAAFVLRFCYHVGLRFSELWGRRVAHLMPPPVHRPARGWTLKVVGPRQQVRAAHIPERAFAILQQYMVDRGHPSDPCGWDPAVPLVGRLTPGRSSETGEEVSLSGIDRTMRHFFQRAGAAASAVKPEWGEQIRRASGLWLRASFVRHAMARGESFVHLSQRLGYTCIHTFEQFESPPEDLAASLRNWDRHLEESFLKAEQSCAARPDVDAKHRIPASADTHGRSRTDVGRK
ncbi:Phage integrase protein (plasmid) [Paraburkholderia caribensis MBA4]|uniref:Phage integrase protein n=1 Tax=Paraburkholderia caribensis MBA4 TaxID=1323664 RepID=A0A0P0RMT6_9BURK|nr:phage integrase family protein [Paraburkholderia caribensis]ALL70128.1 Phage integrase protein [Paraburkholderia caribensis MBA4]